MKRSEETKGMKCRCPYCDEVIILNPLPYCQPCQVELRYCLKCNIAVERKAKVCPQCGEAIQ